MNATLTMPARWQAYKTLANAFVAGCHVTADLHFGWGLTVDTFFSLSTRACARDLLVVPEDVVLRIHGNNDVLGLGFPDLHPFFG